MRPVYRLVIQDDDHTGVTAVALVDEPAIQINWQAFKAKKQLFQIQNEEKRVISGPLMVADMLIPRRDERGEYDVFFDSPTIEQIVLKFFKNKYTTNVNPMHDSMLLLPDVFMYESFIINSAKGINAPLGFDVLPDGSWFGSFKINNDDVWTNFIKTGEFKGFSVEGFFNEEVVKDLTDKEIAQVAQIIS